MRGTIFRQTMFAEFEKLAHASAESGEPLTLDRFKEIYRELLAALLRARFRARRRVEPGVPADPAFLSGVLRLQVRHRHVGGDRPGRSRDRGGPAGTDDYLDFLKGGCSKDPLDLLRDAGVKMTLYAVNTVLAIFRSVGGGIG